MKNQNQSDKRSDSAAKPAQKNAESRGTRQERDTMERAASNHTGDSSRGRDRRE